MNQVSGTTPNQPMGNNNNNPMIPQYNLSGVLHFLQYEWRSFERQRNEWDIERAELKARIASLEGERRVSESVRNDLLRRIKMLEYALRQERNKLISNNSGLDNSSNQSSEAPSPVNYAKHLLKNRASSASIGSQKGKYRKDKCREILKMCLEELNSIPSTIPQGSYFQSPQLSSNVESLVPTQIKEGFNKPESNISTPRNNVNLRKSTLSVEISNEAPPEFVSSPLPPEIVKKPAPTTTITIPESKAGNNGQKSASNTPIPRSRANDISEEEKRKKRITVIVPEDYNGEIFDDMGQNSPMKNSKLTDPDLDPVPLKAKEPLKSNGAEDSQTYSIASLSTSAAGKLSSILKALGKKQEDSLESGETDQLNSDATNPSKLLRENQEISFSKQEPSLNLDVEEPMNISQYSSTKGDKNISTNHSWKPKFTLKSHLDSVRSIDFHYKDLTLVSGSEDGTVKLWDLSSLARFNKKAARQEQEPCFVYRGHTGPITCVNISPEDKVIYSSSFDSTIRAWKYPREGRTIQDPTEPLLELNTFVGHTDIVWNIKLRPNPSGAKSSNDKPLLASVSADKTVKVWDLSNKSSPLLTSHNYIYDEEKVLSKGFAPTSVDFCHSDLNKMLIAYQDSSIHQIDIETGKVIMRFDSQETYDGTTGTQINCLLSHPTMPLVISGHEDSYIRFFDVNSGKTIHSMLAHLGAISSFDVSSSALTLVSGGHDSSIRWWNLSDFSCIQEFSSHRSKTNEAVYSIKFHKEYPWLATAGADSIIKLFTI